MKLTLCLLAAIAVATGINAETWNCGEIDPTTPSGEFSSTVKASLETISGDSVLRIYGNGSMAAFHQAIGYTEAQEPYVVTDAPWDNIAAGFKHVYVENGVQDIGDYAFYSMTQLQNIYISKSVTKIGEGFINDDFDGNIYCSATSADAIPDASGVHTSMAYLPQYFNLAHIYVAPNMAPIFATMTWWKDFGDNISESPLAAAVVTVPQDSLTDSKATILVELVKDADKYEVLVKNVDETDIHHFYTYYDPLTDKWVVEPIAAAPLPARRLPVLRRDTVSRTTEVLQIDITNLQAACNYSYEVTALDIHGAVVGQQGGVFRTPAKQPTGVKDLINDEMIKGKNLKIMHEGQIFIIRDGEWLDVTGRRIN